MMSASNKLKEHDQLQTEKQQETLLMAQTRYLFQ